MLRSLYTAGMQPQAAGMQWPGAATYARRHPQRCPGHSPLILLAIFPFVSFSQGKYVVLFFYPLDFT